MKKTAWVLLMMLSAISWAINGNMGNGDGTEGNPYLIEDLVDFDTFANSANAATYWAAGVHTKLMTNIDLSGRTYIPIGNSTKQYLGVFDGNSLAIANIYINQPTSDYRAVFGYLGANTYISNLGVANFNITGRNAVGGIAGKSYGTIENCYAIGIVNGKADSNGGLVGQNYGQILNSYASCEVNGSGYSTGGLVGGNVGSISNCYTTGTVHGYWNTGGLVGQNSSTITNCYSVSSVQGFNWYVGGLAGRNDGNISNCYAAGNVYSGDRAGGLIGLNSGSVITCYATGSVIAGEEVGGLIGRNSNMIVACYSTGYVSGDYDHMDGGLIGSGGMATACFWDTGTSGQTGSAGGKGLSTEEMKTMSIFQNAGWEGKGWVIEDSQDYPHLFWEDTNGISIPPAQQIPLIGSGSEMDPYQIWTPEDFSLLSWYISVLDKYITLKADLDLSYVKLFPIGDLAVFSGVFDSQGYVIKNANIVLPDSDYTGLFSQVSPNAKIYNFHIEESQVTGRRNTGGLVGKSEGELINCRFVGDVTGRDNLGGLVGENNGKIKNCYTNGKVRCPLGYAGGLTGGNRGSLLTSLSGSEVSGSDVGGLAGKNVGVISDSYAKGKLTGNYSGGLVAINSATINYCYSTSIVSGIHTNGLLGRYRGGAITGCFWDTETTGVADPENGTADTDGMIGKNTTEMQMQSTFTDWNFTTPVWKMLREGEDYPRLAWQEVYGGDIAGLYGVDMIDMAYLARYWGLDDCNGADDCGRADIDSNGDVGIGDLAAVAEDWLNGI